MLKRGGSIGCEVWGKGDASDVVLCFGAWNCVGGFGFGLYLGFRRGIWCAGLVLDCIWDFGVGFGGVLCVLRFEGLIY